jgi:hypothetical protein
MSLCCLTISGPNSCPPTHIRIQPYIPLFVGAFTSAAPIGYMFGLPSLLVDMADRHREDAELQATNPQTTGTAPPTPRVADLKLDAAFDQDYGDPRLQLTRSLSHSEDPANTGGADIDSLFDAELASLDPADSTPTQACFPPLPGLTALSGFPYSAGYPPVVCAGDETADDMTATSPARGGASPSSSPRLPSPPPFTEVQIGPKSPSVADANQNQLGDAARIDNGSTRRIRPGTKAADMEKGPPLVPLNEVCHLYTPTFRRTLVACPVSRRAKRQSPFTLRIKLITKSLGRFCLPSSRISAGPLPQLYPRPCYRFLSSHYA